MMSLLPVNYSIESAHANAGLGPDTKQPEVPEAADLDSWAQEAYSLDVSAASTLGFPVGNISASYKRQALMFGTSRWRDVTKDGNIYRFGISLRALIVVSEIKTDDSLTLPYVAAKVETRDAQATGQMLIRGYKGSDLADSLPAWQAFGVDAYAEYMKSVSDIQKKVLGNDSKIEPELLSTTVASAALPAPRVSVGFVYGLDAISRGDCMAHCIDRLPTDDPEISHAVRAAYEAYVGGGERSEPTRDQRHQAKEDLRGLRLAHRIGH